MLLYTGTVDGSQSALIVVLGDGVSTQLVIDLKKSPLLLNFPSSHYPIQARILPKDGPTPTVTLGANAVVTLTWAKPFAGPPSIASMSPRSQFVLYFIYAGE